MLNVEYEGEYDPERNITFCRFINRPLSTEDTGYLVEENRKLYSKGGENKVWNITDVSEMGMASVKLVKDYHKKQKPLIEKHIIDYCVICSKPLEKIAAQLFNILMGEKHPIFKTKEEAFNWVLKEQETKGRFLPL